MKIKQNISNLKSLEVQSQVRAWKNLHCFMKRMTSSSNNSWIAVNIWLPQSLARKIVFCFWLSNCFCLTFRKLYSKRAIDIVSWFWSFLVSALEILSSTSFKNFPGIVMRLTPDVWVRMQSWNFRICLIWFSVAQSVLSGEILLSLVISDVTEALIGVILILIMSGFIPVCRQSLNLQYGQLFLRSFLKEHLPFPSRHLSDFLEGLTTVLLKNALQESQTTPP